MKNPNRRSRLLCRPPAALAAACVLGLAACTGTGSSGTMPVPTAELSDTGSGATTPPPAAGGSPVVSPAPHQTESNPPGDIPDQQVFVAYAPPGAHFSVKVPEGWARSTTAQGIAFTDKLNSITVQEVPAAIAPSPPA